MSSCQRGIGGHSEGRTEFSAGNLWACFLFHIIFPILIAFAAPDIAHSQDTGVIREPLVGGFDDRAGPFNNAVVAISSNDGGLCTGTLVAPDIVLTSGHCVMGLFSGLTCQACSPVNGRTCTTCLQGINPACTSNMCVTHDLANINGRWHRLPFTVAPVEVSIGRDRANPITTRTANYFNSLPYVGPPVIGNDIIGLKHADIIMIGLSGDEIPKYLAWPRDVWTSRPPGLDASSQVGFVGFSPITSTTRKRAIGRNYTVFKPLEYFITLDAGAFAEGGDSGSPVLFGGWDGDVMGVNATSSGRPRVVSTFSDGNGIWPDIGKWLRENAHRSLCSSLQNVDSAGEDSGRHRKLMNWFSSNRTDNFATSDPRWNGCYPEFDRVVMPDWTYGYFRLEGWVANPSRAQPDGTRPLYLYHNPEQRDNATMTSLHVPPSGWSRVDTLGYVWRNPAPGLVPLRLWFSQAEQDYFTTTQTGDYRPLGYTSLGVIGYVKSATTFDQVMP